MSDAVQRWRRHSLTNVMATMLTASVVEIGLRTLTLPDLAARLSVPMATQPHPAQGTTGPQAAEGAAPELSEAETRRLVTVLAVMRRWPWGSSCLRVALVVGRMLRHRRPQLAIGIRRDSGVVSAHAWLLVDGRALDPEADNYIPLARVERM